MADRAERVCELIGRLGEASNHDVVRAERVSPATSHRLLRALVDSGILERHGRGPAARYRLKRIRRRFALVGLEEDRAWARMAADIARVRQLGNDAAQSLRYAATEMLNNAIEHSRGTVVRVGVSFEPARTTVTTIEDDGVGGGEGIFFSSKAVSAFRLESQRVAWIVDNLTPDTAVGPSDVQRGTRVTLTLTEGRLRPLRDVFGSYTDPESLRFVRTRTTVKLSALGTGLISRSEARRLLQRLTEFSHVMLDFSGVDVVGQGFCDEVFRVFARRHPEIALEPVGMNDAVAFMVGRARVT